jgi:hypothetical protein
MSWSYVLVAAIAMVGAVLGVAIATLLVVKVPLVRQVVRQATVDALRPNEQSPLCNESPKLVEIAAAIEPLRAPIIQSDRSVRLGYFVIETDHAERTRLLVEMFLERETKRWRLDGSSGNGNGNGRDRTRAGGRTVLTYLVRFRRNTRPAAMLERLSAVGRPADFTVRLEADSGDAA